MTARCSRHVGSSVGLLLILLVAIGANQGTASGEEGPSEGGSSEALAEATYALEPSARDLFPETFAGVWLSDSPLPGTINIAFSEDAEQSAELFAQGFPRPELLNGVDVPRSLAELESRQDRMISDRELVRQGALDLPGVPGAEYDLGIELEQNAIYAVVEDATPQAIGSIQALYGNDVIVREGPLAAAAILEDQEDEADELIPDSASCSRNDCRYRLRSGLSVAGSGLCSSAFTVKRPSGTRFLLSAAHCEGSARRHGNEPYGAVTDQKQADRTDAEIHSVTGLFKSRPWIFVDSNEKRRKVRSTSTWEGIPDNARVCKSGQTTGMDCGQITGKHFSPTGYVPNGNRFITTDDMCVQPGDSGSGVYGSNADNPGKAHGVASGAASDGMGNILPCNHRDYFSLFGHIEYVESALNVKVVTRP